MPVAASGARAAAISALVNLGYNQSDASRAVAQAAKPAEPAKPEAPKTDAPVVRVPYVPQVVRDQIRNELREEIVRRWGPRALLALSFGIMAAQLYPTLKYALGHGKACTRVVVAGQALTPRRAAAGAA